MPPKAKPVKTAASESKAIIRTGPKEVAPSTARRGKRNELGEKPSTARALVLRNGKHGAMGSGEVVHSNKITGREKLDLLAEDLMKRMHQAVMSPFKIEQALSISESQFGLYRDDIVNLKDPDLFFNLIEADLTARTRPGVEPRRNATNLARVIGTRIHNSYMLASAWMIVTDTLKTLSLDGLTNHNVKSKLKDDVDVRARYLALYEMTKVLVKMSHQKLAVLATTAPYYADFFKAKSDPTGPDESEVYFDWSDRKLLRTFTQSFLDSIFLELCFPQPQYPENVLYLLLKDCIDESPNESKRFSQAISNALGDLSFSLELQMLLETPLHGPEGEVWKTERHVMPEEFEKWFDAQFFSAEATADVSGWKDQLTPWAGLKRKDKLQTVWKAINFSYIRTAGIDIDRLWQLDNALIVTPQWSSYWIDRIVEEDDEDDGPRFGKSKKKKPLAIMGPDDADDSAGSMPALQSVSNSSEDEDYSDFSEQEDDDEYETESSAYDTDEEDEIRELIREAMEVGHEVDWFDTTPSAPELDPLKADERKGNPFLKALGSLRGRLFKSNPKIKVTTERTEARPNARGAFRATKTGVPKEVPKTAPPKPTPVGQAPPADANAPHKTTIEEVEDEDASTIGGGKKKKKKKPKKKRVAGEADFNTPDSPRTSSAVPASPTTPSRPSFGSSTFGASASTLNIPIGTTTAQSSHSYLKDKDEDKKKIKSRPDHASMFSEPKKKGLLSKLGLGKKDEEHSDKNPKYTWFSRLSKKATDSMHQLLRTSEDAGKQPAPMKWETFLKLMREMGFEYDPSTAGSSVRFDPPNKKDTPISIHKPHPDPTLTPIMLVQIGKRLKRYYGWNEEDFVQQTRDIASKN